MSENISKHYSKIAYRFELQAKSTSKMPDPSWSIVLTFYAALHQINSVLVKCGFDPQSGNHSLRKKIINNSGIGLETIAYEYRALQEASEQIRYHGKMFSIKEYEHLFEEYYMVIKNQIEEIHQNPDFPNDSQISRVSEYLPGNSSHESPRA